jgi:hypothetical protein
MVLASFMANIDLLSVVPQIPESKYPNIHNLVKGSGLLCDGVSLLLVLTTEKTWVSWVEKGSLESTPA